MTSYSEISDIVETYAAKAQKINNDPDLTASGREKKLAALKSEEQAILRPLIIELRKAAVKTALEADGLTGVKWAAGQLESQKLDYSRLQYESVATRSAIILAQADKDPYAMAELWKNVLSGGDKYKIKSFMDIAPATVNQDNLSAMQAANWQEVWATIADGAKLLQSAEQDKYDLEREGKLEELRDIKNSAQLIAEEFGSQNNPNRRVLQRVFEGVGNDPKTGDLVLEFRRELDKYGLLETPDQVINRLEADRGERERMQAEVFNQFETAYDALVDGIG